MKLNHCQGIPYEIDDNVEIWPTPGHTGSDVSVVVRNTNLGTVAVVGECRICFLIYVVVYLLIFPYVLEG